jgi:DNA-binding NarL/FixJ family response regulator
MIPTKIKIALTDDHTLVRSGIKMLINKFDSCKVIMEADGGIDILEQLEKTAILPDILLLDISMPDINGVDVAKEVRRKYPIIKVIALTVQTEESWIHKMIEAGARAYLLKDSKPIHVKNTIENVFQAGYSFDEFVVKQMMKAKNQELEVDEEIGKVKRSSKKTLDILTTREVEFIKLCCSELTYKEIAQEMVISPRTIDGYRESVFSKFGFKSRIGMMLFAINHGLYEPNFE